VGNEHKNREKMTMKPFKAYKETEKKWEGSNALNVLE
jgi:hypothetical protein